MFGYVIRSETVLKGENYKNGIVKIKAEGEKVSKDSSIFRYYTKGEEGLIKKIEELDGKIAEAMENTKTDYSSDIKLLDDKIEKTADNMFRINEIYKIKEAKKEIEDAITKKAKIAGDLSSSGSYVKKLIDERAVLENELNSGTENIKTETAGIVSYKVDGLENVLKPDSLESITSKFLEDLNLKTGQTINASEESGKVVDSFKFYIAIAMNSDKAKEAKIGDNVKLRITSGNPISSKVAYIIEELNGKRVIVFEINSYIEELVSYRKISLEVVWWSDRGLKVPNSALIEEDGLYYVMRNRAGYLDKILVNVLRQNESYAIVDKYKTEELKEMGYTSTQIINMRTIALYDEIVINN